MNRWEAIFFIFTAILVLAVIANASMSQGDNDTATPQLCSGSWNQLIDEQVITGDGAGHGPDIGSDEWKSVVEFKLGVRGSADMPARDTLAWCAYIDKLSEQKSPVMTENKAPLSPSFSCQHAALTGVEKMICQDDELIALDLALATSYRAAMNKANNEHPSVLKATQRGWIKGRDDCWKSPEQYQCIKSAYLRRNAQLQAQYRLVEHSEPVRYLCDNNSANEVVVTFFETDPLTLIAERGDSQSLMYIQRTASGSKYQGRNESFWEHQGEALIVWGFNQAQLRCKKGVAN